MTKTLSLLLKNYTFHNVNSKLYQWRHHLWHMGHTPTILKRKTKQIWKDYWYWGCHSLNPCWYHFTVDCRIWTQNYTILPNIILNSWPKMVKFLLGYLYFSLAISNRRNAMFCLANAGSKHYVKIVTEALKDV